MHDLFTPFMDLAPFKSLPIPPIKPDNIKVNLAVG